MAVDESVRKTGIGGERGAEGFENVQPAGGVGNTQLMLEERGRLGSTREGGKETRKFIWDQTYIEMAKERKEEQDECKAQ